VRRLRADATVQAETDSLTEVTDEKLESLLGQARALQDGISGVAYLRNAKHDYDRCDLLGLRNRAIQGVADAAEYILDSEFEKISRIYCNHDDPVVCPCSVCEIVYMINPETEKKIQAKLQHLLPSCVKLDGNFKNTDAVLFVRNLDGTSSPQQIPVKSITRIKIIRKQ